MAQDHDLVAQGQHHVQVLAHKEDAHPVLLLLVEDVVDGVGGVDVQAPHRVGGDEHVGPRLDLPAQQDLLHVAAGEQAHRSLGGGGDHPQLLNHVLRVRSPQLPVHQGTLAVPVVFQQHVVGDGQGRGQAHA